MFDLTALVVVAGAALIVGLIVGAVCGFVVGVHSVDEKPLKDSRGE